MLFLIGGVLRAGKSTVRRELLRSHGVSGLSTDCLRTMLQYSLQRYTGAHRVPPHRNMHQMRRFVNNFLKGTLLEQGDESFVLEGDILSPLTAKKYVVAGKARAVFLVYPKNSPEEKLEQLRWSNNGWIVGYTDAELLALLSRAIEASQKMKIQCQKLDLDVVDVSRLCLDDVISSALTKLAP